MNKICPNCAASLIYDIKLGKLNCEMCGSSFDVAEFDKDVSNEKSKVDNETVITDKTFNVSIYTCNTCGASISLTKSEASTFCVYCGNPTIVFSRIAKTRKPEKIIPFKITKDEAENIIRSRLKKGLFIPKEVKNFNPELIRGIYIPYYMNGITYADSQIIRSTVKTGKHSSTIRTKVSAFCGFEHITTDASSAFEDSCSQRLEPYNLSELVPFDEDYLSGFYADISDVNPDQSKSTALGRARVLFQEGMYSQVNGSNKNVMRSKPYFCYKYDPVRLMLPVWFCTFRYKDVPYTILVNGQTGTIVGGAPISKKASVLFIIGVFLGELLLLGICPFSFASNIIVSGIAALVSVLVGITFIKKTIKSINRTTSDTMFDFSKKRSEGQ